MQAVKQSLTREATPPQRRVLTAGLMLILALHGAGCGDSAPSELDPAQAQADLSSAFDLDAEAPVALYSDARATGRDDVWLVDFKVPFIEQFMQARFVQTPETWALDKVRPRPSAGQVGEWREVGEFLGEIQRKAAETAGLTMRRMETLSKLIEQYALLDESQQYPNVDFALLGELLLRGGYIDPAVWEHDEDGWGSPFLYHASPEGDVFMLASKGSDGEWDDSVQVYFRRTDERNLTGEGPSSDARNDLILATGTWLQNFEPEG